MMRIIKILRDWLIGFFHKKKLILRPCQLSYIPEYLRTNGREPFQAFRIGELLFMRCTPEKLSNPYNSITISDLSHNRRGNEESPLSESTDVLYNIRPDLDFEKYPDKVVCTIRILDLNNENKYDKSFEDNGDIATIQLIHDPEPCMYPHCIFRILFNGEVVTYDNYKDNIKKANKLRNSLKTELASMIVTETLSQTA